MAAMDFAPRIVAWQRQHGRHDLPWQNTRDPYRIWLSEIMLQQTQVATVIPYYERFLERFPDVAALAAASQEDVMPYWAGLGYYARARNLHRCAVQIAQDWNGRFP
ncbi:MAG: A/G-specific adenine glycosylase, partial [Achromobacter sp.]|nr:A/G-specific adenine glycosylase [Achromobacter sp.]